MRSLGYAGAKAIPKIHFKPCYAFKTIWLQTSVAEGLSGQRQGLCNPTCAMSGHDPLETPYMRRDEWLTSSGDVHTLHSHHAKVTHSWKQGDCHMHPEVAGVFIGHPSSRKWVNSAVLQTSFLLGTHTTASLSPMSPFGATLTFGQGMRRQWAGLAHGLT